MSRHKDWRLRGQEEYLQGATLLRKPYRAGTEAWDQGHCEFCSATFMEPALAPEDPEVLTEGYSVQGRGPDASSKGKMGSVDSPDYWWVCPTCVKDFAQRFEWVVLEEPVSPPTGKKKGRAEIPRGLEEKNALTLRGGSAVPPTPSVAPGRTGTGRSG